MLVVLSRFVITYLHIAKDKWKIIEVKKQTDCQPEVGFNSLVVQSLLLNGDKSQRITISRLPDTHENLYVLVLILLQVSYITHFGLLALRRSLVLIRHRC